MVAGWAALVCVAGVVVIVQMVRMRRGADKVMTALQAGGKGARSALGAWVKPVVPGQKVSANKLVDTMERFSWLALLGDYGALEEEQARQSSPASKVALLRFATVVTRAAGHDANAIEAEANSANVRLARP